jgi:A/G-specific adenine glycosylase
MKFSNCNWYLQIKEICCWRSTNHTNLALIMLQQPRVAQGTPYFLAFRLHSTVFDLLQREEEEVSWQGLGITRARNLHKQLNM